MRYVALENTHAPFIENKNDKNLLDVTLKFLSINLMIYIFMQKLCTKTHILTVGSYCIARNFED